MWSLIVYAGLFITANCLPFPQNQPGAVQASVVPVQALPQPLRPGPNTTPVPIISQTDVENGGGNFTFGFEAGNGIQVQETGYLKQGPPLAKSANQNEDNSIQVILGSFSYPAPDGSNITLTYVADENGFQPQGNHLPTPPPLPESVQRLLSTLQSNAAANGNAPALQASPSANYENIVNPPLASRSAKALESNAAPVAAVQPVSIAASTPKVVASSTTIAPAVPPEQVN